MAPDLVGAMGSKGKGREPRKGRRRRGHGRAAVGESRRHGDHPAHAVPAAKDQTRADEDAARLLTGDSPREILRRLLDSDPLGLELRIRDRLAQRALLLDPERLLARAGARTAYAVHGSRIQVPTREFVLGCIDEAIEELVREDHESERSSQPLAAHDQRFDFLADALGVRVEKARRACVVFNELPDEVRRAYWALVIEGRSVARCGSLGLGSPEEVEGNVKRALLALSLLEDPGPQGRGSRRDR